MTEPGPENDERIEIIFRNGTITVVGIVVAFSLGFLTHWAANPIPWEQVHLLAVVPILTGIALQMKALSDLLHLQSLRRSVHDRAIHIFLAGLILTFGGVGAAILLDVLQMTGSTVLG